MKKWWIKYKQRLAERRRIVDSEMREAAEAVERMRFEQARRRQIKKELKAASRHAKADEAQPPRFAVYLATLLLPKSYSEFVVGDLTEKYPGLKARLGRFGACVHVYKQVFFSAWPFIKESIRRLDMDGFYDWLRAFVYRPVLTSLTLLFLITDVGNNSIKSTVERILPNVSFTTQEDSKSPASLKVRKSSKSQLKPQTRWLTIPSLGRIAVESPMEQIDGVKGEAVKYSIATRVSSNLVMSSSLWVFYTHYDASAAARSLGSPPPMCF